MPVDPGNLICLGRIGERPALVLPGCARSPKLNGIDWVLHRLFAGLKVTPADMMKMGVGGLLKEIDVRPLPREKASAQPPHVVAPRSAPTIAAVVLGAGRSRRMAPHNKLLIADRTGKPMIARVVDNVLSSQCPADPGGDRPSWRSKSNTRWAGGRCGMCTRRTMPRGWRPA